MQSVRHDVLQGTDHEPRLPVASLTAAEPALDTGGAASDAIGSVINAGQMADARHVHCVSLSVGLSPRLGAAR